MNLVLDTNSLFSFFWKGSFIRKLLAKEHALYSLHFALEELNKHKQEILKKAKLSSSNFNELIAELKDLIKFIPFSEYSNRITEAYNLLPKHAKDIDFLALALKLNAAILSNDKELLNQSKIKMFNKINLQHLF